MNSTNNANSLPDDEDFPIQTDRFYHLITLGNIEKIRKKKAYLQIKNDKGVYSINWTCQQIYSLPNSFPSWSLSLKSEGNSITKMIFTDNPKSNNFLKFKLFLNFNMSVKASLIWIYSNCSSNSEKATIDLDERGRFYKKLKDTYLYYY